MYAKIIPAPIMNEVLTEKFKKWLKIENSIRRMMLDQEDELTNIWELFFKEFPEIKNRDFKKSMRIDTLEDHGDYIEISIEGPDKLLMPKMEHIILTNSDNKSGIFIEQVRSTEE